MPYSLEQLPFQDTNFSIHCCNSSYNNSKIHTGLTFQNFLLRSVLSSNVREKERFCSTHSFRVQGCCRVYHLYHKVSQGIDIQEKIEEEISEVFWVRSRSGVHHVCPHSTGKNLVPGHTYKCDKIKAVFRILYTDYNHVYSKVHGKITDCRKSTNNLKTVIIIMII